MPLDMTREHSADPAQESSTTKIDTQKSEDKKESMTELEWLLTGDYKDTTEQHMGNLAENYQVLGEHILYLEENPNVGSILYKVDKKSKKKTKLLENVVCFLEQNNELYYSSYKDSYTE